MTALAVDSDTATSDRLAMRTVENYHRADMSETWLNETTVLLRNSLRFPHYRGLEGSHFWLIVDGTPVGYLHTMSHYERETHQQVLCDIEIREGYRSLGYVRRRHRRSGGARGRLVDYRRFHPARRAGTRLDAGAARP